MSPVVIVFQPSFFLISCSSHVPANSGYQSLWFYSLSLGPQTVPPPPLTARSSQLPCSSVEETLSLFSLHPLAKLQSISELLRAHTGENHFQCVDFPAEEGWTVWTFKTLMMKPRRVSHGGPRLSWCCHWGSKILNRSFFKDNKSHIYMHERDRNSFLLSAVCLGHFDFSLSVFFCVLQKKINKKKKCSALCWI